MVRIRRSHRRGRGSIPRLGSDFVFISYVRVCYGCMRMLLCTLYYTGTQISSNLGRHISCIGFVTKCAFCVCILSLHISAVL